MFVAPRLLDWFSLPHLGRASGTVREAAGRPAGSVVPFSSVFLSALSFLVVVVVLLSFLLLHLPILILLLFFTPSSSSSLRLFIFFFPFSFNSSPFFLSLFHLPLLYFFLSFIPLSYRLARRK